MKIEIKEAEQLLQTEWRSLRLSEPISELVAVKRRLGDGVVLTRHLDGFASHSLRWLWLSAHSGSVQAPAWPDIRARSLDWIEAFKGSEGEDFVSDFFLMISAVLSGDPKIIAAASDASRGADPTKTTNQFFSAFAGVLKNRILKDKAAERIQLEVLKRKRPKPLFRGCRAKIVQAFVESDWTVFQREVRKTIQDEWKKLREEDRVKETASGKVTVDFGTRQYYRYPKSQGVPYQAWWDRDAMFPWCEAAMAALAIREGVEIEGDPLWMPDALIRQGAE